MRNIVLAIGILIVAVIFSGDVYAANQKSSEVQTGSKSQTEQQTQTDSQDKTSQTETQLNDNQRNQNQTEVKVETGAQSQTQSQPEDNPVVEQRRSQVANAVQQMLRIADRNGGIGQQVRVIAQNQTQNQEKLETSLQKIQTRVRVLEFIIGPNYSEINNAKNLLNQNREQIEQLNQLKNQLYNQSDMQNLAQQIQVLEQANLQIENSLQTIQEKVSLFGWLFKLFA